jgi:hypothetical protein
MRSIPTALQAKLDSGVTTLAQAWKLTRRDGVVAGFTDHDRDLVIDGVTYRAGTGLAASEASSRFDLSVDGGEIAGALDDETLTDGISLPGATMPRRSRPGWWIGATCR